MNVNGKETRLIMDVTLILRIAGVGLLVSVINAVLTKSGRDEQAGYVTIGGILVVLLMLVGQIEQLITTVRTVFGL